MHIYIYLIVCTSMRTICVPTILFIKVCKHNLITIHVHIMYKNVHLLKNRTLVGVTRGLPVKMAGRNTKIKEKTRVWGGGGDSHLEAIGR